MIDRIFSNPLFAIGFVFFVVCMILVYLGQRERAQVNQMRGRKGFTPRWSSGRRHRRTSLRGGRSGFSPQWNRERGRGTGRKPTAPVESRTPGRSESGQEPGESDSDDPRSGS
jgi:hypothetical protein